MRYLKLSLVIGLCCGQAVAAGIDPRVAEDAARNGSADAILIFSDQPGAATTSKPVFGYRARRRALVTALRAQADKSQADIRAWLDLHGIAHRDYWIANVIQARIPASDLTALGRRTDIVRIESDVRIPMQLPRAMQAAVPAAKALTSITPGVDRIQAPLVWDAGFTGQGVVIAGEDTGYQWDHPALIAHYRGWNGASADHNYNWHDAIHDASGNLCGNDALAPCDDFGHGTHTMGTMTGDDGAAASPRHQIGVAPGAKWIGCRNMDGGNGTPARYIECMQWMLAPTDLNGNNPDPDLAPEIVSNSWACVPSEGCTVGNEIKTAVDNLVAGGVFYVAAAGNDGSACGTIVDPPAIYDSAFVIGATAVAMTGDVLASFSSRGPVTGSGRIRPDVVAPGVNIESSVPPYAVYQYKYYTTMSGTSMATPHVAGTVALLLSAFPALKGHPDTVAQLLRETAVRSGVTDPVTQTCGGISSLTFPNHALGYGRVDAWNAYHDVIFIDGYDN